MKAITASGRVFRITAARDVRSGGEPKYYAEYEERVTVRVEDIELQAWKNPRLPWQDGRTAEECVQQALKCVDKVGRATDSQTVWIDPYKKVYHVNMACDDFPPLTISMWQGEAERYGYEKCPNEGGA